MAKRIRDAAVCLEQQFRRLRTRTPCCTICAESDPACLELHHPGGRDHDDLTILCRNCHRKLSETQDQIAHLTNYPKSDSGRIGWFLMCHADQMDRSSKTFRAYGEQLLDEDEGSNES
jgi:hypothetical protein